MAAFLYTGIVPGSLIHREMQEELFMREKDMRIMEVSGWLVCFPISWSTATLRVISTALCCLGRMACCGRTLSLGAEHFGRSERVVSKFSVLLELDSSVSPSYSMLCNCLLV